MTHQLAALEDLIRTALGETSSAADLGALLAGDVVVNKVDGTLTTVEARALLDAPIERLWQAIGDYESYAEFLPRVSSSNVLRHDGTKAHIDVRVSLPLPLREVAVVCDVQRRVEAGEHAAARECRWQQRGGDLRHNSGRLSLHAFNADGARTLVRYRVCIEPRQRLPRFIWRKALRWALPAVVRAFERRAKKLEADATRHESSDSALVARSVAS